MDAQAGMLARLFEHSMGLGPEWGVSDVWFEQPEGGPERLHVRVARARRGGAVPGVRPPLRRLRLPRAHLAPPGHLAVRDRRALRGAPRRLPGARPQDRPHALGGAPELALHGALRGAGPRDGDVRHGRDGRRAPGARVGLARVGDAREGRVRGARGRRLLRRDQGRDRRHGPREGAALHIGDGGRGRPQGGRRHRGKGPGRAAATSSRRAAATARP